MLKRMLGIALLAVLALPFVATPSHAVDHSKQWALGYFFEDAPVGVRYMMSPKVGFDFGLGFSSNEGTDPNNESDTVTNSQFSFELGIPYNLVKTDRADFFVRPSFSYQTVPYYLYDSVNDNYSKESTSNTAFGVMLGAEWHATDNLSLSFGHGIGVTNYKPISPGDAVNVEPEGSTSINTIGLTTGFSSIGFRWYF